MISPCRRGSVREQMDLWCLLMNTLLAHEVWSRRLYCRAKQVQWSQTELDSLAALSFDSRGLEQVSQQTSITKSFSCLMGIITLQHDGVRLRQQVWCEWDRDRVGMQPTVVLICVINTFLISWATQIKGQENPGQISWPASRTLLCFLFFSFSSINSPSLTLILLILQSLLRASFLQCIPSKLFPVS